MNNDRLLKAIFFSACYFFSIHVFAAEKLIFTLDLIRHGIRTPLYFIPNDHEQWKEGVGQLTPLGIQQEIQLGKALREAYVKQYKLLPERYDATRIFVRATRAERTIQSAEALMLGLYPLDKRDAIHPIPIQSFVKEKDNLLVVRPHAYHPLSIWRLHQANRQRWDEIFPLIQRPLKHWEEISGQHINSFYDLDYLADNLSIRKWNHLPPPKGLRSEEADQLVHAAQSAQVKKFHLKALTDPMGFAFLRTVFHYFNLAIHHQTQLKYVLFVAHDGTLMSVMNTLGTPLDHIPDFASRINFSLFEAQNRFDIKVTYNDKPIFIPACGGYRCSISAFKKRVAKA